ncbi:MAG: proline dehydrogenase family protein [Candidatus Micrarchaeaceae archaeon]
MNGFFNGIAAKLLAGRWIAGIHADDAIAEAVVFNGRGINVLLNNLGEGYKVKGRIEDTVSKYIYLMDRIAKMRLNASLSVKPSQLGLLIDKGMLRRNYLNIVKRAKEKGIFVWLDMEEHDTVDDTIELYERSLKYGNTGICIQSYLKRSMDDEKRIVDENGTIRLVKGAYTEPRGIAFQSRAEVTRHFSSMMDYLFENANRFMIATHDISMVGKAMHLERIHKKRAMLGMLKGIMNRKAVELADRGEDMNIYIPFGPDWVAYSYRRLTEAGHTSLILKSLVKRQGI